MSPTTPTNHVPPESSQHPNDTQDWKPTGQEFTIRTSLGHLSREMVLQQLAIHNMERDLQSQRREVREGFACMQVDVNAALNRYQGETRNEMQNLHDTLSDRARTQEMTLELQIKRLQQQYLEQSARIDRVEESCSEEHGNLRESQHLILEQIKAVKKAFQKSREAKAKGSPQSDSTDNPGYEPLPPTQPEPEPANDFTKTRAPAEREDCPFCHASYTKKYLKTHIKKMVCRKGQKGGKSSHARTGLAH